MLGLVGVLATELATGSSLPDQLARASGAGHAAALGLLVMAASLAPVLAGRVRPDQAFPSEVSHLNYLIERGLVYRFGCVFGFARVAAGGVPTCAVQAVQVAPHCPSGLC